MNHSDNGLPVVIFKIAKRFVIVIGLIFFIGNARSEEMTKAKAEVTFDKKLLEFAKEAIRLYGDKIPDSAQKGILAQQVLIGMTPYEAKLAGGAFYFKVEADPRYWLSNANPHAVMDKQSVAPDESKIWMTFETETQYPGEGKQRFTVYFFNGKAQYIENTSKIK